MYADLIGNYKKQGIKSPCGNNVLGKSFLIAVFACCRAILYPGTIIVIAAKARSQSINLLKKITKILMPMSPNLRTEIKDVIINQSDASITFYNSSVIQVVTANDNARSGRAHILIYDEYRQLDKGIIDDVLNNFLTTPRQPGYVTKPEYEDYPMEPMKEFFLSSAWFKNHWAYQKMLDYAANFVDITKDYFICALPYQLAIKEKLLDKRKLENNMSESNFNEMSFSMENECMWLGETDGALFSYDDISKNRKLKQAVYPPKDVQLLSDKKVKMPIKESGEIRILSLDVALMSSKKRDNDASSIFITQLKPNSSDRYVTNVIYTENIEDVTTDELALIARRYYHEFDCDWLVQDTAGNGLGVYDQLIRDIYDPDTGELYPAISCINNDEMADRCKVRSAPKVIYSVKATDKFNSECALLLREGFRQGKIRLLISEYDCEDMLESYKGYKNLDATGKAKLQLPYINTTLLINELINLKYEPKGNMIKVYEKSGFRKDRYSSLAYNYWLVTQLELKLGQAKQNNYDFTTFLFKAPNVRGRR